MIATLPQSGQAGTPLALGAAPMWAFLTSGSASAAVSATVLASGTWSKTTITDGTWDKTSVSGGTWTKSNPDDGNWESD